MVKAYGQLGTVTLTSITKCWKNKITLKCIRILVQLTSSPLFCLSCAAQCACLYSPPFLLSLANEGMYFIFWHIPPIFTMMSCFPGRFVTCVTSCVWLSDEIINAQQTFDWQVRRALMIINAQLRFDWQVSRALMILMPWKVSLMPTKEGTNE